MLQWLRLQSRAWLEKSQQWLASYQRKEERLRRWTEHWGHPWHWETAWNSRRSPGAWLCAHWDSTLPPLEQKAIITCATARYWWIGFGLGNPHAFVLRVEEGTLSFCWPCEKVWDSPHQELAPSSWLMWAGATHFLVRRKGDWSQQFPLLADHTSEKTDPLPLLHSSKRPSFNCGELGGLQPMVEQGGGWGLLGAAPSPVHGTALAVSPKCEIQWNPLLKEPGAHKTADLQLIYFWKLSVWQFMFILIKICVFSFLILYQ